MKAGFIAVVGRPNVGKSTLINKLVSEKVAIVSDKAGTTRDNIKGILNFTKDRKAFIKEKIEFFEDLKAKYDLKGIFDVTILLFKKIFKGLGLKLFQICGIIGLDNPCSTGQAIALISVVQTFVPFEVDVQGNFENNVLEGSLYIKGKVRISSIVFPVIWYLLTKPVRTVVIDYVKGDRK